MTIERIDGCIGCGNCVKTCPTDVIRQDPKTGKAVIMYPVREKWCLDQYLQGQRR